MAKGLNQISKEEKRQAIIRRINSRTRGRGYWAAVDAIKFYPELKYLLK